MATTKKFELKKLLDHPIAVYARESDAALSVVRSEISRVKSIQDDQGLPDSVRNQAHADLLELISVLAKMDDADKAFLARVVVSPFHPTYEVVERTVELNINLGRVVATINRLQTIIRLAAQWADTLTAVVTGKAQSMPAEPAPPVDP